MLDGVELVSRVPDVELSLRMLDDGLAPRERYGPGLRSWRLLERDSSSLEAGGRGAFLKKPVIELCCMVKASAAGAQLICYPFDWISLPSRCNYFHLFFAEVKSSILGKLRRVITRYDQATIGGSRDYNAMSNSSCLCSDVHKGYRRLRGVVSAATAE